MSVKHTYIKSPLNYVGGKYKLLSQILPLFPDKIDTFVDLFGGGFNVGINVNANKVIYNDLLLPVVNLLYFMSKTTTEDLLDYIDGLIEEFKLSKTNQQGYLELRDYYNKYKNLNMEFYTLVCYAFNNQIRFNSRGEFNMPFGKNRSNFNPALRQKFIEFADALHTKNIELTNVSFTDFDYSQLKSGDFVYCDPPYFNSVATYNESGGWTEQNERELLNLLDELNERGVKFALSNNLKCDNPLLDKWKDKYNVHYLNCSYSNCNYQKKDKSIDTEVLITNY